jgi:hypothetical protein
MVVVVVVGTVVVVVGAVVVVVGAVVVVVGAVVVVVGAVVVVVGTVVVVVGAVVVVVGAVVVVVGTVVVVVGAGGSSVCITKNNAPGFPIIVAAGFTTGLPPLVIPERKGVVKSPFPVIKSFIALEDQLKPKGTPFAYTYNIRGSNPPPPPPKPPSK